MSHPDIRICFVGDSFVNGTGDPDCLGWTGRVCAVAAGGSDRAVSQARDLTYYNLGVRRETTADISRRWQSEVACRLPKGCDGRVAFSFGVNDTTAEENKTRIALSDSIRNADAILSVAQRHYNVLMVGPLPIADAEQNRRTSELSDRFASLCNALKIPYLNVFTPLSHSEQWMQQVQARDGAHPGAAGYAELADLVQGWDAWLRWFDH
ncbi:lipase [Oculatella sp. LEGE 06141]|uniref:GDSL-type esterase/lipase family protein n=1 Tax=Oculatella sp. LEGE 06141 TaxID=1828648 RepID=UPI001882210E|nr:GDSL-type esterase/lipase family protein [Oculatella sp. LEGE 06141]MBE9180647.1 lipase [Oculatella sp. LEGE 06141]